MVRQGAIDSPPKTPFILGFECSGEVEEIGEGVEDFKVSISQMLSKRVKFLHRLHDWAVRTCTKIAACCGKQRNLNKFLLEQACVCCAIKGL